MNAKVEESNSAKALLLATLAHELTICARDAYEVGTDNVKKPSLLRAYNELLHRVTAAVTEHLLDAPSFSVNTIREMTEEFGQKYNSLGLVTLAWQRAERKT